jgi:hypothetical protein
MSELPSEFDSLSGIEGRQLREGENDGQPTSMGVADNSNLPQMPSESLGEVNRNSREGMLVSERDCLYIDIGKDSIKNSVPTLNDNLARMVTIASAFIGGGFVFSKGDVINHVVAKIALGLMTISLGVALYGLYPQMGRIRFDDPDLVRSKELELINRKSWCLFVVYWITLLTIALAILGVVIGPALPAK